MRDFMISYGVSKICKSIGKEIVVLKKKKELLLFQLSKFKGKDPYWHEIGTSSLQNDIDECDRVTEILVKTYNDITEFQYGEESTFECTKDFMNQYCTNLYERGIENVEYEDIEEQNGEEMVRLYWEEMV